MAKDKVTKEVDTIPQVVELIEGKETVLPVIEIKSDIPHDHIGLTKKGIEGMVVIHKSMSKHFKGDDWEVIADASNKKK